MVWIQIPTLPLHSQEPLSKLPILSKLQFLHLSKSNQSLGAESEWGSCELVGVKCSEWGLAHSKLYLSVG